MFSYSCSPLIVTVTEFYEGKALPVTYLLTNTNKNLNTHFSRGLPFCLTFLGMVIN